MRFIFIFLILCSCYRTKKPIDIQPSDTSLKSSLSDTEKKLLLDEDRENKKWSRVYLNEIDIAMQNEDYSAIIFYIEEYENIPKNIVPLWLRNSPGYTPEITQLEEYFRINNIFLYFLPAE